MALKLNERYPGRFGNPTTAYPQGSFKNRTAPGALDGSYLERDWANDNLGFLSSLLASAGLVPNGSVDQVGASQYFTALQTIIASAATAPNASETVRGIIRIGTQAEANAGANALAAITPATLEGSRPRKARNTAWVNFNGVGTVAINDSYNVSSITDNGVATYTVNFTTPMDNTNYLLSGLARAANANGGQLALQNANTKTVTGMQFITVAAGTAADSPEVMAQFIGGKN